MALRTASHVHPMIDADDLNKHCATGSMNDSLARTVGKKLSSHKQCKASVTYGEKSAIGLPCYCWHIHAYSSELCSSYDAIAKVFARHQKSSRCSSHFHAGSRLVATEHKKGKSICCRGNS